MLTFLRRPVPLAMSILLLGEAALFYAYPKDEIRPEMRSLKQVPATFDSWQLAREYPIETEVQELLRADDSLNRLYVTQGEPSVSLFVALFRSQRSGVAPHSPKVCLPGSGWTPSQALRVSLRLPGRPEEETVNRYIVSKGEQKNLVLYWYQSSTRIIADEYAAKVYTIIDGIRYRRSDTSLVRVIVPIAGDNPEAAQQVALNFLNKSYAELASFLPH